MRQRQKLPLCKALRLECAQERGDKNLSIDESELPASRSYALGETYSQL
jgi:hypothetical protein